ncbi:MAG: hypothetical protein JW783_07555 [Bacteroidales bacterium]|nr:hypothetical protein [Bacteroidales bacterium]MBN2748758.1 hypothetical protein [Bacteroidales bacterium]
MDSNKFVVFDLQNGRVTGSVSYYVTVVLNSLVVTSGVAGLLSAIETQSWFLLGFWAMLIMLSVTLLLLVLAGWYPLYGDLVVLKRGELFYRVGYFSKPLRFSAANVKYVAVSKNSVTMKLHTGSIVFLSFDSMEAWTRTDLQNLLIEISRIEGVECEVKE